MYKKIGPRTKVITILIPRFTAVAKIPTWIPNPKMSVIKPIPASRIPNPPGVTPIKCNKVLRGGARRQTQNGIAYPKAALTTKYRNDCKHRIKNSKNTSINKYLLECLIMDHPSNNSWIFLDRILDLGWTLGKNTESPVTIRIHKNKIIKKSDLYPFNRAKPAAKNPINPPMRSVIKWMEAKVARNF